MFQGSYPVQIKSSMVSLSMVLSYFMPLQKPLFLKLPLSLEKLMEVLMM